MCLKEPRRRSFSGTMARFAQTWHASLQSCGFVSVRPADTTSLAVRRELACEGGRVVLQGACTLARGGDVPLHEFVGPCRQ